MPGRSNILTSFLKQDAVYWGSPVSDGFGGRSFAAGADIKCRWQEGNALFLNDLGREEVSTASVYVGGDLTKGGYLYLGTVAGLDSAELADPQELDGAYEIRGLSKQPSMGGTQFLRKVWLGRR